MKFLTFEVYHNGAIGLKLWRGYNLTGPGSGANFERMEDHGRWDDIWQAKQHQASGRYKSILAKDIIYRTVRSILAREIPDPSGKQILEVGSGSGLVSLDLAQRGAHVTLVDISPEAVRYSRSVFDRTAAQGEMIEASILDLPFQDNKFDVTWNAGVIEHFQGEEQLRALREMLRVTKPEGRVIVAVPWAGARTYARAKAFADRRNMWQPGYEAPMSSFKEIAARLPAILEREYATGSMAQLHFLKYYFARPAWLRMAWVILVEALSVPFFFLNTRPGYLLVAVLKKHI